MSTLLKFFVKRVSVTALSFVSDSAADIYAAGRHATGRIHRAELNLFL